MRLCGAFLGNPRKNCMEFRPGREQANTETEGRRWEDNIKMNLGETGLESIGGVM